MSLHDHASVRGVLFDRDDILLDGRSETDPASAEPIAGARRAVHALREAGFRVGVVADAGGSGRNATTSARLRELVGPFDVWCTCAARDTAAHADALSRAAAELSITPGELVFIGGTAEDVDAARDTGAASILVADPAGTGGAIEHADVVVDSVLDAAALVLHSVTRPKHAAATIGP